MHSNWDKLATWYDSFVGDKGHKYHKILIPVVNNLLEAKPNQNVLDVGCGQGFYAGEITSFDSKYYGLDLSPNMINFAKKKFPTSAFVVGDAANISNINEFKNILFDKALFLLSIQDMDPLRKIISELGTKIKPGGSVVIAMLHPAFRIPRQSGWGNDKARKITYRRMDMYLSEKVIPLDTNVTANNQKIRSFFYHRPLQNYVETFTENNFVLDKLIEISDPKPEFVEFPIYILLRFRKY